MRDNHAIGPPPNKDYAVRLHVASTDEESREEDMEDEADACVYSDGLGIKGMAGAAAVLFRDGHESKSICYQLGPLMQHTTYEVEVVGVLLAVELVCREHGVRLATICLDNQAVVQALGGRSAKPAQALLNLVHEGSATGWTGTGADADNSASTGCPDTMGSMAMSMQTRKPGKRRVKGPAQRSNFWSCCKSAPCHAASWC